MYTLLLYSEGKKKTEFNNLSLEKALNLFTIPLENAFKNKTIAPVEVVIDEDTKEIVYSNLDNLIRDYKGVEIDMFKSGLTTGVIKARKEYLLKIKDTEAYKEEKKGVYAEEYIKKQVDEMELHNNQMKENFINSVSILKDQEIKRLREEKAKAMLNSKIKEVKGLLDSAEYLSNEEVQALYDTLVAEKDTLAIGVVKKYATKNNKTITGASNIISIEDKIKAVNDLYEHTKTWGSKSEFDLVVEKNFPRWDNILAE